MVIMLLIALILGGLWLLRRPRYDHRGFDKNGVHRNGTRFDDEGYDCRGYDAEGFDRDGRDARGYDREGFDKTGFDRKRIHRNGTKYDDDGFDFRGLDEQGFNLYGYDVRGYDREGFDQTGYDCKGKNRRGQYDRLHDPRFHEDGFADPRWCPVGVTNHARERMVERQVVSDPRDADRFAREAFSRGKSKRQLKKTSAMLVEDIESRSENSVVLIYRGFVCIFSKDNQLITVYQNERIPL